MEKELEKLKQWLLRNNSDDQNYDAKIKAYNALATKISLEMKHEKERTRKQNKQRKKYKGFQNNQCIREYKVPQRF